MTQQEGLSYAAAGVDIDAYTRMLERVKPLIAATHGDEVVTGVGPFAGLYRLPGGGHLAASADGVGTKIKVAIACGSHRGIGHDLVNHCVNDIATAGARPLFLLDYFASGRLDEEVFGEVMAGLSEACLENGCALLGGETAEMPGVYALGDYDLAGFVVGITDPDEEREREPVEPGDLLVGLQSSGLHTNGYALVRRVFEDVPLDRVFPALGRPLGEALLVPHRSYVRELRELPWNARAAGRADGRAGPLGLDGAADLPAGRRAGPGRRRRDGGHLQHGPGNGAGHRRPAARAPGRRPRSRAVGPSPGPLPVTDARGGRPPLPEPPLFRLTHSGRALVCRHAGASR